MERIYLAYGSNLNMSQMTFRCPGAKPIGKGYIDGYQLMFKGSKSGSYLTIEERVGSRVPVGAWLVTEEDERSLDRYEGYPTFYYKKEMEIELVNSKTKKKEVKKAFVYIMHENRRLAIPSAYYYDVCYEGYLNFKFDIKYLENAFDYTIRGGM